MPFLKNNEHLLGLLFAALTALCWSVLAILLKNALDFADAETIVAFRMIFAFLTALPIALYFAPKHLTIFKKPPLVLILGSLGLAFNYLGFMKGVELSSASNAQVMIQIGPLFLMASGFFIYKEGINLKQALWLLVAVAGFYIFFNDQLTFNKTQTLIFANIWIITAALTWVWYSLVIRHFTKQGFSAFQLNLIVFLCCALVLSTRVDWSSLAQLSFKQWLYLFFLGLNTLVAYGCFGQALKYAPASQVSVIITSNPILTLIIIAVGSPLTPLIPYEPVNLNGYIGATIVIAGIIFSTLSAKKSAKKSVGQT